MKCKHLVLLLAAAFSAFAAACAQRPQQPDVPVLMLSDIHFDPFHDPEKFAQLLNAPVEKWAAILDAPSSPGEDADFSQLQSACAAHGVDTPWTLLKSSLAAEYARAARPLFITVSGDLLTHGFDCRFRTLAGEGNAQQYAAFAAKTVAFVALELRQRFPGVPIYFALGNNDSGCGDYREDARSGFLTSVGETFAESASSEPEERARIAAGVADLGDYSVRLPVAHTRLIVLDDIFASANYKTCAGKADNGTAAAAQLDWLRGQLDEARAAHDHVWVMTHIPAGVDVYATVVTHRDVCAGQAPVMFLRDDAMADLLAAHADVVRLVVSAHTHMDEMRLYRDGKGEAVAVKLVPSITPVNGNHPAFTVAEVEARSATLADYTVYAASNASGVAASWNEEYRYAATYHRGAYAPAEVGSLLGELQADTAGNSPAAMAYERFFYAGDSGLHALALHAVWPAYACALTHDHAGEYRSCVCSAAGPHH